MGHYLGLRMLHRKPIRLAFSLDGMTPVSEGGLIGKPGRAQSLSQLVFGDILR
jgi:hypothetical protein